MTGWWRYAGKAIAGVVGAVATALAAGQLHGNMALVASGAVIIATGLGVYHAPAVTDGSKG